MPVNFDRVAEDYDASRYLPAHAAHRIAAFLCRAASLSPQSLLLDAATGTGRFALPLAVHGVRVVGVDIAERMLARLRSKMPSASLPIRLLRSDLTALGLTHQAFDAVLMAHILHLIPNWQQALQEAFRVLKPNGVLLLVWNQGEHSRIRHQYHELLRGRFEIPGYQGAHSSEIARWLQEQGKVVEVLDTRHLHWQWQAPIAQTVDFLQKRVWSRLWRVPDEVHDSVMKELHAWVLATYGSFDGFEVIEGGIMVQKVS
ncbi:MAG TPA: methyltransferase domain-containing protein [Chthonomonas sp.]|uniref:class I SAM-dependent methyltransferase n=1 Tax=Chthonomonas sp. TaxID=2282153 RepID=UPI002B4B22C0|nr:methyltransferase domain-containing protein [Chthonomonas sp.]HLI47885.1 methyltransferase domain-containing protein [Chthonomonas sp.]